MNFNYLRYFLQFTSIPSICLLLILSISQFSKVLAQNPKGGIDWIVVVDTSASMRGVGGTRNIFAQVKNSINEFVNTAKLGDTVTIYNFDSDVTLQAQEIPIVSNPDRGKLKQIINNLKADGVRTHTGKAVQQALSTSAKLNQRPNTADRTVSIVFLTDGLEDVQGIPNPVPIPQSTQLLREQECKPYVFFVSLGLKEHEKQLNEFANNPALCGKGRVLRDPGGVQLNKLAQNIRPTLIQPQIDFSLSTVDLPPVLPGTTTKALNINSISNVNAKVSLQLEDLEKSGISLVSPKRINLAANKQQVIPISLQIPVNAQGGNRKLRLLLTATDKAIAPQAIDLSVTIKPQLSVQPSSFNFGSVESGKTSQTQTLIVRSSISGTASLQLQGKTKDISLKEPSTSVSLAVGETKIPIQIEVADNSFDGKRKFNVVVTPDNPLTSPLSAEVQMQILMPLGRKIVIWTLLILLLFLITLSIICLIQRKTPWELAQDIGTRNHLEGEIELLEPAPISPEEQYISLTHQHRQKVNLSALVPAIASTNSDAELVINWQSGKKYVYIRSVSGITFVNNEKITTYQLYDEDTIQVDNVKLRFNWIGNQRPYEQNSGLTDF
ncbi:von Willebrand factor, type A [Trichormus variabilis ATCC 29413]|uniref:von Willebrand factor, type A n=2 Tax=Anabaena variabilis TaxID=264691 RepID=Q3M3V6_TRIV2|nr:von Willebrand factor, type A [Trichormus variabilis ATCC 29413]MBC1213091.1 VWA domain-containing protein [Trichormus variabilis ARAD]MBC1254136.1 VWA domain-containing protein [Trichormus variabilis V5]MBC1267430.1 VWA domain-containing protein [Trichormus variabilis FSR]MBC1301201.1 VWA domain-containing protein [Trichormus variabilis N2B]MBC1311088.1 VWA domain-containing protein [Trichormus variabilis PNB]MBC1325959.1 VWA domain-containing protein [Trichormus variabilis 9RC]MBD238029